MEETIRHLIGKLIAAIKVVPHPKKVMWDAVGIGESLQESFSKIVKDLGTPNIENYEEALSEFENIVDILNDINDAVTRTRATLRGAIERDSDDILDNLRQYMAEKMAHKCLES
jgi:hypothetical protein